MRLGAHLFKRRLLVLDVFPLPWDGNVTVAISQLLPDSSNNMAGTRVPASAHAAGRSQQAGPPDPLLHALLHAPAFGGCLFVTAAEQRAAPDADNRPARAGTLSRSATISQGYSVTRAGRDKNQTTPEARLYTTAHEHCPTHKMTKQPPLVQSWRRFGPTPGVSSDHSSCATDLPPLPAGAPSLLP